jgi:hypothetical protein
MSTNWAKVLLFTLLGFALGWIMSCLLCAPCMGRGDCSGNAACHAAASCGHGAAMGRCCKPGAHHDHPHEAMADSSHTH